MNLPSIYDDLTNTDLGEKVDKLKEQNEKLRSHVKILEGDIEKLCQELTKMKRHEDNLKKNISSLYNTSKTEIERKDRMIAELRKQLDDLLFKRSKVYSKSNWSGEQQGPLGAPSFYKRRHEISEPEPNMNKRQKCDLESNSHKEITKPQSELPVKTERHKDVTRERESSRSYSNSPSRRERSHSRYRHRNSNRSRSKSRERYRIQDQNRRRERHRSRDKSMQSNKSEKEDKSCLKDLRKVLSNRKSNKTAALKTNVSDKKFKSNGHISNTSEEIIVTRNDGTKNNDQSFDNNKHKTCLVNNGTEHNAITTTVNSSRSSINASGRRRCVIKILT